MLKIQFHPELIWNTEASDLAAGEVQQALQADDRASSCHLKAQQIDRDMVATAFNAINNAVL